MTRSLIAEIIFTGTELLLGQTLNTNAQYLQQALAAQGLDLYRQVTVGDNLVRCAEAIREARADLVFIGGGLGPTEDDVSREALGEALGLPLVQDETALQIVQRFFVSRGLKMAANNLKQALVPPGGLVLDNPIGTAPGVVLAHGDKHFFLLPGPPQEFSRMVEEQVIPYLKRHFAARLGVISSRIVKFCGIGESTLDQSLADLLKSTNPTLAPSAKEGQVHLRITAKAGDEATALKMIAEMETALRQRLGGHIFGTGGDTLEGAVGRLLAGRKVALAESFTGGVLGEFLALDPVAAGTLACGLVLTGATTAKVALPPELLGRPGEGLKEAAARMATAVRAYAGSDFGLAVTGAEVADARSIDRFTACIATDDGVSCRTKEMRLWGSRSQAARRAAEAALILLWRSLKEN
ncbi:MAG TPA: CinA family nicotinamide mononucleotide deamidase-related protein [Spirochaetia bacterium]|nr:CinA family nicotinamide mononucleotide deamidase-related protein [Spirochaetia bacterium]